MFANSEKFAEAKCKNNSPKYSAPFRLPRNHRKFRKFRIIRPLHHGFPYNFSGSDAAGAWALPPLPLALPRAHPHLAPSILPCRSNEITRSDGGAGGVEEIDSDFRRPGKEVGGQKGRKRWLLSFSPVPYRPFRPVTNNP